MSSTRLSEYLDHQALVAKLADVSEQCYKLLQLCNDLEKNLNDHNTDPEAHLDIRKAIEVVSGRLDTANTTFNTHISNIRNTYDAEVAELKKKDTDLENNLEEVSDKLDTVEKGEHVYDNSIKSEVVADDILAAAKGDAIIQSTTDKDGVVMLASLESPSGIYTLGSNHDEFEVNFHSDSDLAKNSPAATQSVVLLDKNGNSKFGKNVSAEQFTGSLVGNVTGNADTATNASKFNGLVTTDFIRTTGNVNQTITGTKTFSSPIVGNLQGTADNADKLDNLDSSDFVRRTDDVAETITGDKTFSAIVYGDNFQPKSGNKTGTIGTNSNGYKTIYVEHVEASTIIGDVTGALTGNADTATQLRTPRKINGTDFDGTTAIVTEIWGTTRNFCIADSTGKHTSIPIGVNGSGTVTLRLPPKIDAETTSNANTATKLRTPRKINDTDFDGTHDITTANWGTARNISITDGTNTSTAVSVNGSQAYSLNLPSTIKATFVGNVTGNADTATNASKFNGLVTTDFIRTTGNVNQTITGTKTFSDNVHASGFHSTSSTSFMAQRGEYTLVLRNDGSNTYLLMSDKGGVPGTWSSARPLVINNSTGVCDINGNAATATNATNAAKLGNIASSGYVQTGKVNQTIAGTKTFSAAIVGSVTGNAGSATKLATARTINGTSFNGTANITTANWGTARNISITDGTNTSTAVSVNGSANVSLKLPATIKANLTGNSDTATKATQDSDGNQINTTYSKVGHTHDDRYYTETEVNNLLKGKANSSHTHSYIPTSASCNKNWHWSGQGGQPSWLWGGEDGTNMYVYNPSNFSVNYANSAGYANWLRTSSHSNHLFHTEWDNAGYFWTYVTAGNGEYRAVRVARSDSAVRDAAGNTITTTYATKAENNTKANDSDVVHKSGNETIVGTKTFNDNVHANGFHSTTPNGFMAQYGGYTLVLRNDGSNTYLLMSDENGVPGTWSSARPLVISNSTGVCDINGNAATASRSTNNGGFYINNYLVTIG